MPVPPYDALMLPVLRYAGAREWQMSDLIRQIGDDLGLSDDERSALLPSQSTTIVASRVHWAKTYLKKAGLIEQPRRGAIRLTTRGRAVLERPPERIDSAFLQQFDEFRAFVDKPIAPPADDPAGAPPFVAAPQTPEEEIDTASVALDGALRDALLARILENSPKFFERTIVDLLLAMGYGSRGDGEALGRSGDGGIDGVIREDQLGLDRVYLQAKRYAPGNTIGSETVQAFIGALYGNGAQKGVLITTSTYSRQARAVASQSGALRLVLIDGEQLTKLMVRFNVGVRTKRVVEVKEIDLNYFSGDETE